MLEGDIEVVVDGQPEMVSGGSIRVIPARAWHSFTNRSTRPCLMVNIHSSPRLIQENWADLVREGISLGFKGFRCDAAYKVPAELWSDLVEAGLLRADAPVPA